MTDVLLDQAVAATLKSTLATSTSNEGESGHHPRSGLRFHKSPKLKHYRRSPIWDIRSTIVQYLPFSPADIVDVGR